MRLRTGKLLECRICLTNFYKPLCRIKSGNGVYCSRICKNKGMIGHIPWNKTNASSSCGTCKKIFHIKPSKLKWGKGKFCSKECTYESFLGRISPNFKGTSAPNTLVRASGLYDRWRKSVFARDNYTCLNCYRRGSDLEADHTLPFGKFIERRLDVNNGRTLCKPCHKIKTEQDWMLERLAKQYGQSWITS